MRDSIQQIIDNNLSAVILNVKQEVLNDVVDFIKSFDYNYEIFNSSGNQSTVRLGFINGLNEYTGSEEFIKSRIFSELATINSIIEANIDSYFLEYIVEWIYYLHIMDSPLNYLDKDKALFDYLINFFENKYYEDNAVEDDVAIKFLRIVEELLYTEDDLPIMQFRDKLFKKPSILVVCEDNPIKNMYIEQMLKDYYEQYVSIDEDDSGLVFIKLQN